MKRAKCILDFCGTLAGKHTDQLPSTSQSALYSVVLPPECFFGMVEPAHAKPLKVRGPRLRQK